MTTVHVIRYIDGVPILHRRGLIMPRSLAAFPDCCGAGRGLGQVLVPERIWGLRISPACYVHDDDWDTAAPTWEAFRAANSRFLENINTLIEHTTRWAIVRVLRRYRAATYYSAVSEASAIFWRIKKQQLDDGRWPGMMLPRNITPARGRNNG